MDKYTGLHKVEVTVSPNNTTSSRRKMEGGYLKTLLWQTVIAALLCGVLFCCKVWGNNALRSFSQKAKEAVCFDAFAYVASMIADDEEQSG